jgi:hypothetical protein
MHELSKEIEQQVLNELGYTIKLLLMPMNTIIPFPDAYKSD